MDGTDNATVLWAPSSLLPDNYTLSPNASSPGPGADFSLAPASTPGLSLGPGSSFSAGPTPTPQPTTTTAAAVATGGQGSSPFPRPWVPHEPPFWDTPLSHGLNVLVGAALCITMLGLGCTVDVNHFGTHLRRPVGALLAALCQFGFLPLLAFLLALAFKLDEVAAVAVLLCGCCPGGNLSNLMSLLVDGDMNLRYGLCVLAAAFSLSSSPGHDCSVRWGPQNSGWEEGGQGRQTGEAERLVSPGLQPLGGLASRGWGSGAGTRRKCQR